MDGVRRLLGGGGASDNTSSGSALQPPPRSSSSDSSNGVALSTSKPSWPPMSPTEIKPLAQTFGFTQGLFIRKESKVLSPVQAESNLNVNASPSSSQTALSSTPRTMSSSNRTSLSVTTSPPARTVNPTKSPKSPPSSAGSPLGNNARTIPRKSVPPMGGGITSPPVPSSLSMSKRHSVGANARDELIMSILASEALVDCHDLPILSSEEVEDLKKQHQALTSRIGSLTQKIATETKIRDAAVSLSKFNAQHKKVSKLTEDQLSAANKRLEATQQEFRMNSEQLNEVYRKLLEHRAGILSFSVRSMEKNINLDPLVSSLNNGTWGSTNGSNGDNRNSNMSSPTTILSDAPLTSSPTQARFEGAHFFAGHVDAVVPKRVLFGGAATQEISSLEEKLKAATAALKDAGKKQAELTRDLAMMRLEKEEVKTRMGMELETAQDTIAGLERELPKLEALDEEVKLFKEEKQRWKDERERLEGERAREVKDLKQRMELLQTQSSGEMQGTEKLITEMRETNQREMEKKDSRIREMEEGLRTLKAEMKRKEEEWEKKRTMMEDEKMEDLARLQNEMDRLHDQDASVLQQTHAVLDSGLIAVKNIVKQHGIVLFSRESSLPGLLESIGTHLDGVHQKLDSLSAAQKEWEAAKRKLEEDVRAGLDKRESLTRGIEEVRKERDKVVQEVRALKALSNNSSPQLRSPLSPSVGLPPIPLANFSPPPVPTQPVEYTGDAAKIVAILLPLWNILPSPEARASKFAAPTRQWHPVTPPRHDNTSTPTMSLSDLDVRTLKTLYGVRLTNNTAGGPFSVEAFVGRVQALINDDKALIERLIRFAQAHDLLKKNAERAQKLAQETNGALETYQKQVKTLEERNMTLATKQANVQEEINTLQQRIDRVTAEKLQVETLAAEQAQTLTELTQANNTLSAKTLSLAQEAASAPENVKKHLETVQRQLEKELNKCKAELEESQKEIEMLRMSEQSQSMALLEELNAVQNNNEVLRAQLRAANAGKK